MSNYDFIKHAEILNAAENISNDIPSFNADIAFRNYSHADYQYEVIKKQIKEFESSLDDKHEVAIRLASFGQSLLMAVHEICYANPSLIIFYGIVQEQESILIQHISQLNFLLTSVERVSNKPKRQIGFSISTDI